MADRIRPIALAALFTLSRTVEGGNDRLFSIDEIAQAAQPLSTSLTMSYNDLRNSLATYLATAVGTRGDPHFAGDRHRGLYELTEDGQDFYDTMVSMAAACQQNVRTTASAPTTSSSSSSSSSSRFIPGTLVRSAASARDSDDDDNDSGRDGSAALVARDNSATRKPSSSSSSSQRPENHPSAYSNMTGKRGRDQQSSSTSSSTAAAAGSANGSRQPRPALSKPSAGIHSRLF